MEDHLFGDKEKFVTAAYKKKLQEQQLWEAELKIRCAREAQLRCDSSCFGGDFVMRLRPHG